MRAGTSTWPTPAMLMRHFEDAEAECARILAQPAADPKTGRTIVMAQPAYDQCIKAIHLFNLLDARGVISVTERQAYIGRVRALAKACADAFVTTEAGGRGRRVNGKIVAGFLVVSGLVAGAAIYWLQIYAFYEPVAVSSPQAAISLTTVTGVTEPLLTAGFTGIDADSSPLQVPGLLHDADLAGDPDRDLRDL